MSLALNQGTEPQGLLVKTFGPMFAGVHVGDYTISEADFCEVVLYFLINTDLEPSDPRLKLLEQIGRLEQVDGWKDGGKRFGFVPAVDAPPQEKQR